MTPSPSHPADPPRQERHHPFRRAVLRGLGVVLPPLLTIVLFIWAWTTIERYVLQPIERAGHRVVLWRIADVRPERDAPPGTRPFEAVELAPGRWYVKLESGRLIPKEVYDTVRKVDELPPETSSGYYDRYVSIRYFRRAYVIPVFLLVFIIALYFVGKFLAAGAGRIMWNAFESLIQRVPVIRNVYSAVKQVTDFVFSEREIEFNRVVAVEYPRKGVWSLGFVTGESMLDIRSAANEPVVSVLMPTSPMPATGFTITVPKSETVDLNITVDQAIQFIVSCGVVVPPQQQAGEDDVAAAITAAIARRAARPGLAAGPAPGGDAPSNGQPRTPESPKRAAGTPEQAGGEKSGPGSRP